MCGPDLSTRKPIYALPPLQALLDIGPRSDDMPALLKLLRDRDGTTREAAIRCLGKLGPAAKESVPRLAENPDR